MVSDNQFLGSFRLTGIPPRPAGKGLVEFEFAIDSDGILTVTAEALDNLGNKASIKITSQRCSFDSDEIEKMIREAERFAEEDKIIKQNVLAKNEVERFAYLAKSRIVNEKRLSQLNRDKIINAATNTLEWVQMHPAEDKLIYEGKLQNLKDVVIPIAGNILRDEL